MNAATPLLRRMKQIAGRRRWWLIQVGALVAYLVLAL
jgi:hypothetical protein